MAFTSGSTSFGVYDADPAFITDADRLVKYVSVKLGGGLPGTAGVNRVQVELESSDVYTCFEDAVIEYGAIINAYQAKSSLAAFLGSSTGSLDSGQSRYPRASLEWARRQSQAYGEEAYVGGDHHLYSGSIDLVPGQQDYDLQVELGLTGSDERIIVRQIFHFSPFASQRYFGTTSAMSYLNAEFGAQTFTAGSVFYMMPVWEDILRGMQMETANRVRRSNYSFEMHNNVLKLFPIPQSTNRCFFTYHMSNEMGPLDPDDGLSFGVSNLANIPFGNIQYSKINSIGRQWIWRMTLALAKEILGLKRRKMANIPIPGGDLQLDGSDMVGDGRGEMEALRNELRGILEEMSYDKLAAKEAEQAESLLRVLSGIPLKIYTG